MLFGEFPSDRITVDPDEFVLEDLARITGEKKENPAVARAVTEFIGCKKAREFVSISTRPVSSSTIISFLPIESARKAPPGRDDLAVRLKAAP